MAADAAELAGLEGGQASTVEATADFKDVLRIEADPVCYMMLLPDVERICALLESGKNVVTTAGLMFPHWTDAAAAARLERACARGKTSFYVTGINPGWVDEVLPLTMSALCRRIKRIHIREYADCSKYPAPHIINVMGFGKPLEDINEGRLPDLAVMRDFFTQSLAALAKGLELKLDNITESREFVMASEAYDIKAGHVAKGTIAGQRWRWQGIADGVPRIVQETYWITAFDLGEGWPRGRCSRTTTRSGGSPSKARRRCAAPSSRATALPRRRSRRLDPRLQPFRTRHRDGGREQPGRGGAARPGILLGSSDLAAAHAAGKSPMPRQSRYSRLGPLLHRRFFGLPPCGVRS